MARRRILWIAAAAALVLALLSMPERAAGPARAGLLRSLSPVVRFGHGVIAGASGMRGLWASRARLADENDLLRKRVKALTMENLSLLQLRSENRRLRRLLDFRDAAPRRMLPAQVVGRDTRQWYGSILIDRGSDDGVRPDMAVVSEDGLVGKVIEALPGVSRVLLLVDRTSRVGGVVERTRETGVVEGTSFNTCRLTYLPRRTEARPGDRVLSSGMGGVYPKGLYVGEVTGVHEGEYGLFSYADLSTGVNFSMLEEVLVVAGAGGDDEGDFMR
ncbi:MAG: rod shape-determining protein MreC [bacterium]|nr:rod shape-determining protein MreC [bacterium]